MRIIQETAKVGLRKGEGSPQIRVRLAGHLKGVAAIAEQRRLTGQNHSETGRSGETADEGKPFLARRHLFTLEHVLAADIPAIKTAPRQDRPQVGKLVRGGGVGHAGSPEDVVEGRSGCHRDRRRPSRAGRMTSVVHSPIRIRLASRSPCPA